MLSQGTLGELVSMKNQKKKFRITSIALILVEEADRVQVFFKCS